MLLFVVAAAAVDGGNVLMPYCHSSKTATMTSVSINASSLHRAALFVECVLL